MTVSKAMTADIPGLTVKSGKRGWPQNELQLKFVKAYVLESKSAIQACIDAGYKKNWARTRGYELPKRLVECITWLRGIKEKAIEKEMNISATLVVSEFAALAMVNWQDYLVPVEMEDGTVRMFGKPINKLTPGQARCVKEFSLRVLRPKPEVATDDVPLKVFINTDWVAGDKAVTVYDYVLFDRNENLVHLARHFDLFHERKDGVFAPPPKTNSFKDVPASDLEALIQAIDRVADRNRGEVLDGEFEDKTSGRSLQ